MSAEMSARADRLDRGSVSTEMAIVMAVFLVSFLALVLYAGRVAVAENAAQSAAQAGARAATLEFDLGSAQATGRSVASRNLADRGLHCDVPSVSVVQNGIPWGPGATIAVTVTCTADKSDVPDLQIGGTHRFTETAYEIVDVFRSEP